MLFFEYYGGKDIKNALNRTHFSDFTYFFYLKK